MNQNIKKSSIKTKEKENEWIKISSSQKTNSIKLHSYPIASCKWVDG